MGACQSTKTEAAKTYPIHVEIQIPYVDVVKAAEEKANIETWLRQVGEVTKINSNTRTDETRMHKWLGRITTIIAEIESKNDLDISELAQSWCSREINRNGFASLNHPQDTRANKADAVELRHVSLRFGTFTGPNKYASLRIEEDPLICHRMVVSKWKICFFISALDAHLYCLEIEMDELFKNVVLHSGEKDCDLFLHMRQRPRIHRHSETNASITSLENKDWLRYDTIPKLSNDVIGASDVVKISVPNSQKQELMKLVNRLSSDSWNCSYARISSENMALINLDDLLRNYSPDFPVVYLLAMMHSRGLKVQTHMHQQNDFIKWLLNSKDSINRKTALVKELMNLCERNDNWHLINWQLVREDYDKINSFSSKNYRIMIRRVVITPTRVLLEAEEATDSSRILRDNDKDSFLRASFRDEDGNLLSNGRADGEFISGIIGDRLHGGINLAGRRYHYLAQSNSLLKDHGCYLYAEDSRGMKAEDLRRTIGKLDGIRCVAKHVARLGMAFSSTSRGLHIHRDRISYEDDIFSSSWIDGVKYNFSDGIGRISKAMLEELSEKVSKIKANGQLASALQIRHGGDKGVLVVDPTLQGKTVKFRKSMHKFDSDNKMLDIQATSVPKPLYLNHQIVTILSQFGGPGNASGVSDEFFLSLQEETINDTLWSLLDEDKAIKLLSPSLSKMIDMKSLPGRVPWQVTSIPFFKQLLVEKAKQKLHSVMTKARIPIDRTKGRNMMGVLDETATLEYGQVFVQYSSDTQSKSRSYNILEGPVVVSKMPALHPGDARKLLAIDVPELHHLKDVIAFPQKGPRPHPNEMAGSDLDGDEYWVCWDPKIIPRGDNCSPMIYPPHPERTQDRPVTEEDMIDYMVQYIQSDITSIVARSHLCDSDRTPSGIYSEECLELAKLHSRAIDAPKTGEKVMLPAWLKSDSAPDFLDKSDHKMSYESGRILGKLYRECKMIYNAMTSLQRQHTNELGRSNYSEHGKKWNVNVLESDLERYFQDAADAALDKYTSDINNLMKTFEIESEVQLYAGSVFHLKLSKDAKFGRQREIQEKLKALRAEMRKVLQDKVRYLEISQDEKETKYNLAYACFKMAETNHRCLNTQGFPWLVADWLKQSMSKTAQGSSHEILGRKIYIECIELLRKSAAAKLCLEKLSVSDFEIGKLNLCLVLVYLVFVSFRGARTDAVQKLWSTILSSAEKSEIHIHRPNVESNFFLALKSAKHAFIRKFGSGSPRKSEILSLVENINEKVMCDTGKLYAVVLFGLFYDRASFDKSMREMISSRIADLLLFGKIKPLPGLVGGEATELNAPKQQEAVTQIIMLSKDAMEHLKTPGMQHALQELDKIDIIDNKSGKCEVIGQPRAIVKFQTLVEKLNKTQHRQQVGKKRICFGCGREGHIKRDCPKYN